jgi:hypothetical protein
VTSGQAEAARVEQAAVVLGITMTYDYRLTGETWAARLNAGRLTWTQVSDVPGAA